MKKLCSLIIITMILILPVSAQTTDEILNGQLKQAGANSLSDGIPNDTAEEIEDNFGHELNTENVKDFLDFKSMLAFLLKSFFKIFKKEAALFSSIMIVILLNRLFKGLCTSFTSSSTEKIVDIVSLLALTIAVSVNITSAVSEVSNMVEQITVFTESLIPVMTTLMISAGQPASSAVVNTFLFIGCEICTYISSNVILPLINIYFASVICESLIFETEITAITEFIKKIVLILTGTVLTVFVAMMSLQSVISGTGDSLSKRGIKFAVGALIPVASGVLSEAMESVFSCANVARSLTGIFGIVAIIFIIITPLLLVLSKYLLFKFGAFSGKLLNGGKLAVFLDGCASVFSMLLTVTIAICVILISALTLVIITIPK